MNGSKCFMRAAATLAALLCSAAAWGDEVLDRAISLSAEERPKEARALLEEFLEREPDHPRARLLDGVLQAREGRVDEAIDVFEALRRDHPDRVEAYNNLAVLYAVKGRLEDARMTLVGALAQGPDPLVYGNLGDVYAELARRAYRRARELSSGDGIPSHGKIGTVLSLAGGTGTMHADAGDATAAKQEDATPDPTGFCARAGGFEGRHDVAVAVSWLQAHGVEGVEVHHEERRVARSHRVYLPPLASRAEADAKLREIRGRGVRDVAIIGDGALENGISFGVYTEAKNMRRRVAALDSLGYDVETGAVDIDVLEEYVVNMRAADPLDALRSAWTPRFPEQAMEPVACGP